MFAGCLIWLGAFALYIHSASPGPAFEDMAELTVCALSLSNSHPPGYPLHALAGRLFMLLPLGSLPFRLGIMSASFGALAVVALYRVIRLLAGPDGAGRPAAAAGALAAAFTFAASPSFWWQSGIVEKYTMFMAAFGWAAWAALKYSRTREGVWLNSFMFLCGLAAACHYQALYLAVPVVWAALRGGRSAVPAVLLGLLPLSLRLLYVPIRAMDQSVPDWEHASTLGRFADYLSLAVYRGDRFVSGGLFSLSGISEYGRRLAVHLFAVTWQELGLAVLGSAAGLVVLWRASRAEARGLLAVAVAGLLASAMYMSPNYAIYDIPILWLLAAALGVAAVRLSSRHAAACWLAALVPAYFIQANAGYSFSSRDYMARDHLRNVEASAGEGTVVFSAYEAWLNFALYSRIVGQNPGIQGLHAGVLSRGLPAYADLARETGGRPAGLERFQEGFAMYRKVAGLLAPRRTMIDILKMPQPSAGAAWRGILLQVAPGGAGGPYDGESARAAGRLRLRGLLRAGPGGEYFIVRTYSSSLCSQGKDALGAGKPAEALRLARLGLRIDPRLPELLDLEGRAQLALGRMNRAEDAWKTAVEVTQSAGFNYFEPFLGLAKIAARRGARDEALENIRTAALMGGAAPALVRDADRARREGRNVEAERGYRQAVAAAYDGYGRRYMDAMKVAQASRSWEAALEQDPGSAQAMFSLGTICALEERFEDALAWFDRAARLAPHGTEIAEARRKAREAMLWRARIPALERRLAREAPSATLFVEAGNAYWYLGRAKVAESFYRDALRLDPRSARAWGNLGSALVEQRRLHEGMEAYERAVEADPGNVGAMINLGSVNLGMGEREKAAEWLERVLELDPENARAMELLGEARSNGGTAAAGSGDGGG